MSEHDMKHASFTPKSGSPLMASKLKSTSLGLRNLATAGLLTSLLAGMALSGTVLPSHAAGSAADMQDMAGNDKNVYTKRLQMTVGRSIILDLPSDAAEIFVGSPTIANAVVRSARKIYLVGVANGSTTIFAMNKEGKRIAVLEVVVGRDTEELRTLLRAAMPKSDINVRTVADTIILSGTVDSALEAEKAADIATAFVGYSAVGGQGGGANSVNFGSATVVQGKLINSITIRGRDQVMLKVTIAEVSRVIAKQLGVSLTGGWGLLNSNSSGSLGSSNFSIDTFKSFGMSSVGSQGSFGVNMQALERSGVGHVLAEPTVAAISGESAKFTAGGEIPVYKTETPPNAGAPGIVTYEYKPYGITLNFTPTVLSEGRIQLHLATEVTEVDSLGGVGATSRKMPGFTTRRHETTLELPSGGSIVSAGLIQQHSTQTIDSVPGLGKLPILGALFSSRDYMKNETELMIMVTPYITRTLNPNEVSRPDDGFAEASDPQANFLGRVNRIYSTSHNPQLLKSFKGRLGFITD